MFGQDLSRKKIYPTAMKVNPPGTEIVRSDLFICLETVSLSLVSAQEGCLTSLRCLPSLVRQLPSFSTTAESETVSRQIKSVLTSVLSLGFTFLGSRNIYSWVPGHLYWNTPTPPQKRIFLGPRSPTPPEKNFPGFPVKNFLWSLVTDPPKILNFPWDIFH